MTCSDCSSRTSILELPKLKGIIQKDNEDEVAVKVHPDVVNKLIGEDFIIALRRNYIATKESLFLLSKKARFIVSNSTLMDFHETS